MDIITELNTLSDNELTELDIRLKITPDMHIHMSKKPIHKLEKRLYAQISGDKPHGLWYGFGDEWIDWTETAGPERKGEYIYEVDIDSSNILQIKDYPEIARFTKEYGSSKQIIPGKIFSIDWSRIEYKYDGIEINPYLYHARLDDKFLWYYSWDVASGCIWNLEKVKISLLGLLNY
jgi:hypothetical protein